MHQTWVQISTMYTQTQLGSKREDHQAPGPCCHEQLWTEEAELTIEPPSRQAGMAAAQG